MKKIALVGSAPSSVHLAPYGNPEWEVWACSPGAWPVAGPTAKKWFELHRWEPGQPWMSVEYCEFLNNFGGEVITVGHIESIKHNKTLDVEYLVDKYGPYFFTSSLAWMFAMAIDEGATSIGLWGVDMAATEEYGFQRAGCQYFGQLARQMGIEVGVPPESDLFRPAPLYGVCEHSHNWKKTIARERELTERLRQAEQKTIQGKEEALFLKGALDDLGYSRQTWMGHVDTMGKGYVEPPEVPKQAKLLISGGHVGGGMTGSDFTITHVDYPKPAKKKTTKKRKKKVKNVTRPK